MNQKCEANGFSSICFLSDWTIHSITKTIRWQFLDSSKECLPGIEITNEFIDSHKFLTLWITWNYSLVKFNICSSLTFAYISLLRVNPGFNQAYSHQQPFSPANDDWYLQGQLQQRRVRQKYFDATGERFSWNNFDDYNNPRFRNNYNY